MNIEEFKDDPLGLFKQLQKIWRDEIKTKNKKTTDLILELNKKHSVDICDLAVKAIDSGFSCFDTHLILVQNPRMQ